MALIQLSDVTIAFRGPPLLDGVNCQIEAGGRIGLLGRNGSGKTTLMRLLAGELQPDHGQVTVAPGVRVAQLPQEVPQDLSGAVEEIVSQGLDPEAWQDELAWRSQQKLDRLVEQMQLDPAIEFATLSSGMKRRVLLARTLIAQPDVLLLDEPTNHLDIDAIRWLEDFLLRWPATLLFVTHDRVFLRHVATRILEIDRGRLFDWSCDYETFLTRKEQALAAEEKQNALFDKRLAEEEAWIRRGIKARRTRNEGRVRALKQMRIERINRREREGASRLQIQEGQRSGMLVAELKEVSFAYPDKPIVEDFSTTVMRGDKIGLVGPNGVGKSTLLKILLGQLSPQAGSVRLGTNLEIAYFDQLREQLDGERSVQENVSPNSDTLTLNGQPRHVMGYLQDFLFTPERVRTQVKFLSGGERNRVLLARLFAKPANVIVLDEPTNDLDAETLELLEEKLIDFGGTLLVVSHDREFLNNVVTSTIVFERGTVREYVGGYDDWLRQRAADETTPTLASKKNEKSVEPQSVPTKRKLGYKEKRELEALPARIEQLEAAAAALHAEMAEGDFYRQPPEQIGARQAELKSLEAELAAAYGRWETLEE